MLYSKEKLAQLTNRWTTAKGKRLIKLIKKNHFYLSPTLFREKVSGLPFINDEEVSGAVDLRGAPLAGFDFRVSIQESDDGFMEEMAVLSDVHFEGANLSHCNFLDGKILKCYFENSNLAHAEFRNSVISDCSFEEADLTWVNLNSVKLSDCNFANSCLKDVKLDTVIADEYTNFGKKLKSESENNYHFAAVEYKQIKEMYKNSSLHNKADFYHYKEMVAKRRATKLSSPTRWLNYIFGDLLCKYGTSFTRVFLWSILAIVGFAALIFNHDSLAVSGAPVKATFGDAIYFSLVTFTTLGYGDFHAIGAMRFVAGLESYIGVTLMSLFTIIVARRIIRD